MGHEIGMALLKFLYISLGSLALGVVMGLIYSFVRVDSLLVCTHVFVLFRQVTKHLDMTKMYILEQCILLTWAYLAYLLPEALTLSGIMSLLFFGQTVAHYGFYNMSVESKVASRQMIKVTATLTETAIFVFLGMSLFGVSWESFHWELIGWTMVRKLLWSIVPMLTGCSC